MKKISLIVVAIITLLIAREALGAKYVGDYKALELHENPKQVEAMVKAGTDTPIVIGYYKVGLDNKLHISTSKSCCGLSLQGNSCIPMYNSKALK